MFSLEEGNIGKVKLKNKVAMAPMCMYSAGNDGMPLDFHIVHYGSCALGGVGLVIVEATAVSPEGRISENDLGLWSDEQTEGHRRITSVIRKMGSVPAVQLNHAGRKAEVSDDIIYAPSDIRFSSEYKTPAEMTSKDIERIKKDFVEAAKRAVKAGYEIIEIHGAHGYLISEFLSPLSNKRTDEYGGSYENRARFLYETASEVKKAIGDIPMTLRVSAMDYKEGGNSPEDMAELVGCVKEFFDLIHVSSGGVAEDAKIKAYPGYQVEFARTIREKCQIPVMAVGLIVTMEQIEEILGNKRADFVSLGRALLRDPNFILNNSRGKAEIPVQLERAYPEKK